MRYRADLQIGGKVAGIGQRLLDQVAKLMTRQGLEALSREMELRIGATLGGASASFGIAGAAVVEGEVVAEGDGDEVDDAAAANPESGDAPDAGAVVGGDEEVVVIVMSEDAQPSAEAPLAPGVPDEPAPVADLDQELPPGTIG
jgi:hypothetical protein